MGLFVLAVDWANANDNDTSPRTILCVNRRRNEKKRKNKGKNTFKPTTTEKKN